MEKLKIDFENCFGINRLDQELNFGDFNSIIIYASNGVMKTSFANTFKQLEQGKQPVDRLFYKPTSCQVLVDGNPVAKEFISVIKSFDDINTIPSQTKLLVDEKSKAEYDEIFTEIEDQKKKVIIAVNHSSGIKKDSLESILLEAFSKDNIFDLFTDFENATISEDFSEIKFAEVFNSDVLSFLAQPTVIENIQDYFSKYQSILEKSSLYKAGVFNPSKADNVANSLKKENFFNAEHSVNLKGVEETFTDFNSLSKRLLKEKQEIIGNEELLKIEQQIKKVAVKNFRELLEKHNILTELADLDEFKKKLLLSHLEKERFHIIELNETYRNGFARLREIEEKAEQQATSWDNVIKIFKDRFFVPFDVIIQNKSSSILGKDVPNIQFIFHDEATGADSSFEQNDLGRKEILSQGEKRAMYLLNVMFNIEARKAESVPTLYIFDDIADSFDYKNKYAIIQYLSDLSEEENTYQIILTHNFDFFRTIQSRVLGGKYSRTHSFVTIKENNHLTLVGSGHKYQADPFNYWKKNLDNKRFLISSIPFVRNLIEFKGTQVDAEFKLLTSLLHSKTESQSVLIRDLKIIYDDIIESKGLESHDENMIIIDLILEEAQNIYDNHVEVGINLEEKIVISMATRVLAEKYIWTKISDKSEITIFQMAVLFKRFKLEFGNTLKDELKILEEVNLVTPENIHLNSFMFEPIMDLSLHHLKKIYNNVKQILLNSTE